VEMQDHLNLRQAAEVLQLEPMRLYRLGRHLHLAPGDPCLPSAVIDRARVEADEEARYRLILDWLLAYLRGTISFGADGSRTGSWAESISSNQLNRN
jgi:hypothetical protein